MGLIIEHILQEKGMSQKDLADKIHMTPTNISRIIQGKAIPKADTLQRIADALEVTIADLYGGAERQEFVCPHCGKRFVIVKADMFI